MTTKLTRWGLWALPVGGVLTFFPWLATALMGARYDPVKDPVAYARGVTSVGQIAWADVYMIGTVCIIFGLFALYAVLSDTAGAGWAAAGAIAGSVAMIVVVAIWMVLSLAGSIVGDVVLSGHADAAQTFQWMSGGHWNGRIVPYLVVLIAAGLIGAVAMGVAMWRSGRYAKWLAVAFAVAFALEATSSPPTVLGALLLVITGVLIARQERVLTPVVQPAPA
jgi:hypothetical protein